MENKLETLIRLEEEEIESKKRLLYDKYLKILHKQKEIENSLIIDSIDNPIPDDNGCFVCLKEPLEFIDVFVDILNSQEKCKERFKKLLNDKDPRVIQQIIKKTPDYGEDYWFNSTSKCINLRPGLQDNQNTKPKVVTICNPEDNVHGLIVGSTGSGKSVFLHNLLFSLMKEYSPWELNLFLVDFKKVTLSKYLSNVQTPHIKAVAATSEVRYVISLLKYLNNCMRARQNLLSLLGLEKLDQLRKEYKIILPRVLLIVDEFQQLFVEAIGNEDTVIKDIMVSITKLGRATGYHLLFASQEMTGTLSSSAFANFRIRFALRCNSDVSREYLGNKAASEINPREFGIVIENSVDGHEENNVTYKVPFIDDSNSEYFNNYLHNLCILADKVGYKSVHKYYQEDYAKNFDKLIDILQNNKVFEKKKEVIEKNPDIVDIITLGDAVIFNYKKIDYETMILERGIKKNIGIYSPSVKDIAYLCKLLATNFNYSPNKNKYTNYFFTKDDLFLRYFNIENELEIKKENIFRRDDDVNEMIKSVKLRKQEIDLLKSFDQYDDLSGFVYNAMIIKAKYYLDDKKLAKAIPVFELIKNNFLNKKIQNIPEIVESIKKQFEINDVYFNTIDKLYKYKVKNFDINDLYDFKVFWIVGIDQIDVKLDSAYEKVFSDSLEYNTLFIFTSSSTFDNFNSIYKTCCDYNIINGNQNEVYMKLDINPTKKNDDSIVFDLFIRNSKTQKSFKKFFVNNADLPFIELDFDEILEHDDN